MTDVFSRPADGPVEGNAVQRDVLLAFEYAHNEDDWIFPLADALAGVTAEEVAWIPDTSDPKSRSIWRIVLHMTVWTENIVERMGQRARREPHGKPAEGSWPDLPPVLDARAWEHDKQRLWAATAALRAHIAETPMSAMLDEGDVGYSQLADLLCRLVHNAYHIGQITKLRDWRATEIEARQAIAQVVSG